VVEGDGRNLDCFITNNIMCNGVRIYVLSCIHPMDDIRLLGHA